MQLDISVACDCGEDITLQMAQCAACGAEVTEALRADLEARLEGAHPDYRETKAKVRGGRILLMVIGFSCVLFGILSAWVTLNVDSDLPLSAATKVVWLLEVLGAGYLVLAWLSKRRPIAAMSLAMVLWVGHWLLRAWQDPASLLILFVSVSGIALVFLLCAVLMMMTRALFAARHLQQLSRELGLPGGH